MGSGKGQTRRARAQAVAGPAGAADVYDSVWLDFLTAQGLTRQTLASYYSGAPVNGTMKFDFEETEKLFTDFFRDLIELGAVALPSGRSSDGYSMCVMTASDGRGQNLFLKSDQPARTPGGEFFPLIHSPCLWLEEGARLWDAEMQDFLLSLFRALKALP